MFEDNSTHVKTTATTAPPIYYNTSSSLSIYDCTLNEDQAEHDEYAYSYIDSDFPPKSAEITCVANSIQIDQYYTSLLPYRTPRNNAITSPATEIEDDDR